MRTQHVAAFGPLDALPNADTLPDGYAVLRNGLTYVVRSHLWVRITPQSASSSPVVTNPPPAPTAPVTGPPSEAEIHAWMVPVVLTFTSTDSNDATPDDGSAYVSSHSPVAISGGPANTFYESQTPGLLVARQGWYSVSLRLLEASEDTTSGLRRTVFASVATPQTNGNSLGRNGVAMEWGPGQQRAFGGGLLYVGPAGSSGNAFLDQLLRTMTFDYLVSHPAGHSDVGWAQVQVLLTPVLFTDAAAPPPNPMRIRDAQAQLLSSTQVQFSCYVDQEQSISDLTVTARILRADGQALPAPISLLGSSPFQGTMTHSLDPGTKVLWQLDAFSSANNLSSSASGSFITQEV